MSDGDRYTSWPAPGGPHEGPQRSTRAALPVARASERFALAIGWCVMIAALSRLTVTARRLEHPPVWIREWFAPFVAPVLVLVACLVSVRLALALSMIAAAAMAAFAVADLRGGRSGLGRYEVALAVSGALLTAAVGLWTADASRRSGRRPPEPPAPAPPTPPPAPPAPR